MVNPLYSFQHNVMPALVQEDPGLFYFLAENGADAYYSLIDKTFEKSGVRNPYDVKDCCVSRLNYMNISIVVLHAPGKIKTGMYQDSCLIYDIDTRELRYFCTERGSNTRDGKPCFVFCEFAKNGKYIIHDQLVFSNDTQATLYGIRLFLTQFMHCNVGIPNHKSFNKNHAHNSDELRVTCPTCDEKFVLDMSNIKASETYVYICPKCGEIMFANWGGTADES